MQQSGINFSGLSEQEVLVSRSRYGKNETAYKDKNLFAQLLKSTVKDPMIIMLAIASGIYFLNGTVAEGIFLLCAIALVASISIFQQSRSKNALETLKAITQPTAKVIRERVVREIPSEEIVIDDYLIIEEGGLIPADGVIVHSNDFSVNESLLTGESLPLMKDKGSENNLVFQGTLVVSGLAICKVSNIGAGTKLGEIGKNLKNVKAEKSPLQRKIENFVKKMALVGVFFFIIIWAINIYLTKNILDSLLSALTLAMSILPEEIPVAFATFMALGAWKLMKSGIIVKETKTVETLGSADIICVDKTGTITKNEMSMNKIYVHAKKKTFDIDAIKNIPEAIDVVSIGMWASEPIPFDPMEKAFHDAYGTLSTIDLRPSFHMVHEYPLGGKPPLMTHVFKADNGDEIIAGKGAPEALILHSNLSPSEEEAVMETFKKLAGEGFRVLGIGEAKVAGHHYPEKQEELVFEFKGLVSFYDPPKENIAAVMQSFYKAGINVKIITGDTMATAKAIAKQINFVGSETALTGEEVLSLSGDSLTKAILETNIFARMFPEAKLRVIEVLKEEKKIVAMTGDGINDAPALKAAHIGIAMGKKGSETAKQVSSLILIDDDLERMVGAVAMGRKIYNNLKKGIQYIISIHIPIILIVFIPLVLGWIYPALFTPVHIIFLELIMGPTCSIIYENEPIEKNLMEQKPRPYTTTFFNSGEITTSILQGLVITLGLIFIYWFAVDNKGTEELTTALVFIALITSNIFLTLVNRSFYYSIFTTLKYKNSLIPIVIAVTILLVVSIFAIPGLRSFFKFEIPTLYQITLSVFTGLTAVIWFEVYKWVTRKNHFLK